MAGEFEASMAPPMACKPRKMTSVTADQAMPAQRRTGDKDAEPPHVDGFVPAQVAQAAKGQQQAAQHEQVDGHHPLDGGHVALESSCAGRAGWY